MTTPATSALPRIAVPATVDMQDTVGDGPDPIVLPATAIAAKPTLRDSLRAELSVQLDETARWTDQLRENRNLLRRTEYEAWGRFLQTTDQQVSDALAANNEPEARRLILAAHKALSDLNRFFEIEKAQHLLATHAETGVRIYLVDNQLYFVSPDHKAFDYKANSESLKGFVRIDTQSGAIEQTAYQEEGRTRAKLPSRSSEEEIALLGCRIDRLALYERPDKSYAVTTKLRTVSPGFRDHEIRFSLADVLAGQGLSSNPNDPAVIQRMNAIGPNPAAQPKSEPESTSVEGATGHAVQGRTVIAAATTPMRVLDAKRRGAAAPALDDAARQKIETEYTKHRARVSALDVDTLNEPKAIAEALKTLDDERGAFREAVSAREKILRAELARTEPGSPEAAAKQLELQQLESLRASETMKTRALLERQAAGSDPIASKAAKVRLISMAAEVDDAYKAQISAEPTDAGKQKLTAEQQKFQQDIEGWKAEVRRWPAKIAASVADFLENNSWVKRIRAIGSPHPIRDYLDRTRAVRAADALKENPSLCAKDMSTMDVKAKAAYLDELAAQDKLFKARIQTLERQITSGTKGLEPELQQYREARAAVASRSVECAAEQIKDAGPDGQGTPKLRANYCTLADAAEEAYQQLEKSRPLTADEQKARAGIRAQREGYRLQQDIDATRMRLPGLDERDIARRDAARAEKKAEAAPAGPQKTEAEAARDLARTRQVITEVEARVSHLKSRLNLDRENRDLAKQLADAEAELKTLRITELNQVQVLKRAQIGTMTARIAEIDAELA
ncbi:MAG TPA: hypothetical protein PLP17_03610, partial [Oligoflexia bacterium]|nr:hypothetical protein [Oligoflexia bacterium]